jgi:hypothetical protein
MRTITLLGNLQILNIQEIKISDMFLLGTISGIKNKKSYFYTSKKQFYFIDLN